MTAVDAEAFFLSRADAVGVGPSGPARSPTCSTGWIDCRSPCSSRRRGCASSLDQLLERLSARLDLEGDRDADPRQRTLRSTIGWSADP